MHTITITQVEDGSIMLLSSEGTMAEKALELCLAAVTMYRADVKEKGEAAEKSGGAGGVRDKSLCLTILKVRHRDVSCSRD